MLFDRLRSYEYVLLNPTPLRSNIKELDLLVKKNELKPMVDHLQKMTAVSSFNLVPSFHRSNLVLKFKDQAELMLRFVHKFAYKSLIYLDEEEVLRKKVENQDGQWILNIEHAFEHFILDNFLQFKGISKSAFQHFSEFHILVQEDLLEYFNTKYSTAFSSIYQLTDFDEQQRSQMIKYLKSSPNNQFMKSFNVRWNSFLGSMRQARL